MTEEVLSRRHRGTENGALFLNLRIFIILFFKICCDNDEQEGSVANEVGEAC